MLLFLPGSMLFSFLRAALRSIRRHSGFLFINVFGLGLGLAGFALIMLFVTFPRGIGYLSLRLRRIFLILTAVTGLIACPGLTGLAAFTAQQRTKATGVRKVPGASIPGIVGFLSREFTILVLFGLVLAIPATWNGMGLWLKLWLKTFPYQSGTGILSFAVAGIGTLLIALASVSFQSLRAAVAETVESLR